MKQPDRRSRRGVRLFLRENWYRDVWLLVVTALVAVALLSFGGQQDDIQKQQDDIQKQQARLTRLAHANHELNRKLCRVVIDSHGAAQSRLAGERRRRRQTLAYLRDPASRTENPALYERVRTSFAAIEADIAASRRSAMATRPPRRCVRLVHETAAQ